MDQPAGHRRGQWAPREALGNWGRPAGPFSHFPSWGPRRGSWAGEPTELQCHSHGTTEAGGLASPPSSPAEPASNSGQGWGGDCSHLVLPEVPTSLPACRAPPPLPGTLGPVLLTPSPTGLSPAPWSAALGSPCLPRQWPPPARPHTDRTIAPACPPSPCTPAPQAPPAGMGPTGSGLQPQPPGHRDSPQEGQEDKA